MKLYFVSSIFDASKPKEGKILQIALNVQNAFILLKDTNLICRIFLLLKNHSNKMNISMKNILLSDNLRHFYNIFGNLDKIELFNLLRLCPRKSHI